MTSADPEPTADTAGNSVDIVGSFIDLGNHVQSMDNSEAKLR